MVPRRSIRRIMAAILGAGCPLTLIHDGGWTTVGSVSDTLPMFPLNTVLFPGVSVPLHVFEDRYRALVHHLLRVEDPTERIFGSVGIREGYEVGEHGSQSLFRVGCRAQLTEVEGHPDGTFD